MSAFKVSTLSTQISELDRTASNTYVSKAGGSIGGNLTVSNLEVTGALTKNGQAFTGGGLSVSNVTLGVTTIPSNGYSNSIVSVPALTIRRAPPQPLISYGRVELRTHNNVSLFGGSVGGSITLTVRHDLGDSNYLVYSTPDDRINVKVGTQNFGLNTFQMVVKNMNDGYNIPVGICGVNYQIVQCQAIGAGDVVTLAQPVTVNTPNVTLTASGPESSSNVFALSAASHPQGYAVLYTFATAAPARTSVVDGSNICYFTTGGANTSSFTLIASIADNPYIIDVTKRVNVSLIETELFPEGILGAAAMVSMLPPVAVLSSTQYTYTVPSIYTYQNTPVSTSAGDTWISLTLGFPFWWAGKDYGNGANGGIWLNAYGVLTFGGPSSYFTQYTGYPAVFLGALDNMSWEKVQTKSNSGGPYYVRVDGYLTYTTYNFGEGGDFWVSTTKDPVTYELSFENDGRILFSAINSPNNSGGYCALADGPGTVYASYTLTAQAANTYTQYEFGRDNGPVKITIPFSFVLNGTDYGNDLNGGVYICKSSYITFGASSAVSQNLSAASPNTPTILIGSGNWSCQGVYVYDDSVKGLYRVRYEGVNTVNITQPQPATITWEVVFKNNNKVYLCVEKHTNPTNTSGVSNGAGTWLKSFNASPGPILNITPT